MCGHFTNYAVAAVEALRSMLVIKCLRPDRLLQSTALFVQTIFENELSTELDLGAMVANEVPATTPLALVSVTGYDASYRVENLIQTVGARSSSVAMGSQEGFTLADQAISVASRQGTWVLLKNVHLAPSWLGQLEKKLHILNPHRNFRLFLTMEANPAIPVNILRQSRIIMNEPPPGIKANLLDSLRSIAPHRLTQGPAEKVRLYFLLAWFHTIVQECLCYVPLGWSKTYDFNDSDMVTAFATIVPFLFGSHRFVEITYSRYVIQERDILSSSLSLCTLGLYKTKNCEVEHIGKDLGRKGVDGNWLGSYKVLDPGLVDLNLPANTEELLLKVLFFLYDIGADR